MVIFSSLGVNSEVLVENEQEANDLALAAPSRIRQQYRATVLNSGK